MPVPRWTLFMLLLTSCGPGPTERLKTRVHEVIGDERRGAGAEIDQKLKEMDRRIQRLQTAIHSALRDKDRAKQRLQTLERQRQELRLELDRARRSGEQAMDTLEKTIDRILDEVEQRIDPSAPTPQGTTGA